MFFEFIKIPAQLALSIYCRDIKINHKEFLNSQGPLIIASNHPNSFLDAVIIATILKKPVYSLARGDAFSNKFVSKILAKLNMLPVYRMSEGSENLETNYHTFDACIDIFKKNGIVLIFSEGLCENEWHLRPLKKGTARIGMKSWEKIIPLKILPLGINYSSFHKFGKNIQLDFGELISRDQFSSSDSFGKKINQFNDVLQNELKKLVAEISDDNYQKVKEIFHVPQSGIKKILLFLPAMIGYVLNIPIYFMIKTLLKNFFDTDVYYDSIMVALLFLLYPVYLIVLCILAYSFIGNPWWMLILPVTIFTAWSYVQLKKQF